MNDPKPIRIAIDGPVGAGKGTVAHILRQRIGGSDIYTGGTYRAVALYCLRHNIDLDDSSKIASVLADIQVNVENETIYLDGEDVTEEIKKSEVANATPKVASVLEIRKAMIEVQRKAVERERMKNNSIIVEGRDIGKNVLPDAEFKIFLTADSTTRAIRRLSQLQSYGETADLEKVKQEVEDRDRRDTERENDPLEKDPASKGYFIVDNSGQTEEQTVAVIIEEMKKRNFI